MKGNRKSSANDTSYVKGVQKIAGMQVDIGFSELARDERFAKEGRRRDIIRYVKRCLVKGESIEKVLIEAKLYAQRIGGNPESVTRKMIERFARDLGLDEEER